jgi:hypothetical protein
MFMMCNIFSQYRIRCCPFTPVTLKSSMSFTTFSLVGSLGSLSLTLRNNRKRNETSLNASDSEEDIWFSD